MSAYTHTETEMTLMREWTMEFSDLWSQVGSCLTIREKNRLPMDQDALTTLSGNASGPGLKERPKLELIRPEKRKDNRENKEKMQGDKKHRDFRT